MRSFLVAGLLLLTALAATPPASAQEACTGTSPDACFGDENCAATVVTTGTSACVLHVEGVFDPTGYYLIVCAVEGAVHACVTDDSESTPCINVEANILCPFDVSVASSSPESHCDGSPSPNVCVLSDGYPTCVLGLRVWDTMTYYGCAGFRWMSGHYWAEVCAIKGNVDQFCVWYDNANDPPGGCRIGSFSCTF